MSLNRRAILTAGLGIGALSAVAGRAAAADARAQTAGAPSPLAALKPNATHDQTAVLQALIDDAAAKDVPVVLPAGVFVVSDLRLRRGTRLVGAPGATVLRYAGGAAFITADAADGLVVRDMIFDGAFQTFDGQRGEGLVSISHAAGIDISAIEIKHSAGGGLSLIRAGGRVTGVRVHDVLDFGIKSLDGAGLDIAQSSIGDCGNNGILIWRSEKGEDGSKVSDNRISNVRNASGGSGQFGNGVNVFRAAGVIVSGNRISDCSYTAVRGNTADNLQILGNNCARLGEVALYSEFGFEGAVIANNVVDGAACGIAVTNFDQGGRLATIQGNLIRNLFRREHEDVDKRGEGIGVEADAAVTGNTIEGAPTAGIQIGWGAFLRDIAVTGNVIRQAKIGISVSSDEAAGSCLIANNLISNSKDGAIRKMTLGVPAGPDLAREPASDERIAINGNVAV